MVAEYTMYPAWDNDDDTQNSIGLSIHTNNHGIPKYPRKIDNPDDKEMVAAVEEGVQVDKHVFTKTNSSRKEVKSKSKIKRSKGKEILLPV